VSRNGRLVVKDNALIDASFNLSLVEQRLLLLAIIEAREVSNLTTDTALEIKAYTYQEQFNIDESNSYKQLHEASRQLFNRHFSYLDRYKSNDVVTFARWINRASYMNDKGTVILYLSNEVISLISRLEKHFTKYLLDQVAGLKSQYSIRFYELFARYLPLGNSKKYEVQELRSLLGIGDTEYKSIAYLKRDVIDKAINEINKKTDITVSYEQFKQGRTITHLLFKMKQKHTKQKKQAEKIISFTEKQLDMFSDKLSKLPSFQNHYLADTGVSTEEYAQQIKAKLSEPSTVKQWIPYLNEVGYKGI